jgi:hypothetical protein
MSHTTKASGMGRNEVVGSSTHGHDKEAVANKVAAAGASTTAGAAEVAAATSKLDAQR